jgi:hypothetical protein
VTPYADVLSPDGGMRVTGLTWAEGSERSWRGNLEMRQWKGQGFSPRPQSRAMQVQVPSPSLGKLADFCESLSTWPWLLIQYGTLLKNVP